MGGGTHFQTEWSVTTTVVAVFTCLVYYYLTQFLSSFLIRYIICLLTIYCSMYSKLIGMVISDPSYWHKYCYHYLNRTFSGSPKFKKAELLLHIMCALPLASLDVFSKLLLQFCESGRVSIPVYNPSFFTLHVFRDPQEKHLLVTIFEPSDVLRGVGACTNGNRKLLPRIANALIMAYLLTCRLKRSLTEGIRLDVPVFFLGRLLDFKGRMVFASPLLGKFPRFCCKIASLTGVRYFDLCLGDSQAILERLHL